MKYSRKIQFICAVILIVLLAKAYATIYYDVPILDFPLVGICVVLIGWIFAVHYEKVRNASERDVLTELYNRRYLLQTYPKFLMKLRRKQEKLILYFIDVDDFKQINDSLGHDIGDQVLQEIAKSLVLHSQKRDLVVRYAGDEFVILSPTKDDHNRSRVVNELRLVIQSLSDQFKISISVSIGTAIYPDEALTMDDLLHKADRDMYSLKVSQSID